MAQKTQLAEALGKALANKGWQLATAESCTGGGIAESITAVPGSSDWFGYGFVTYSNQAKSDLLGVPESLVQKHGAVSQATVEAMATGAAKRAQADIAVAVSGVAGPTGGTVKNPVGSVWLAWYQSQGGDGKPLLISRLYRFEGDRQRVREQTIQAALEGVLSLAEGKAV